MLQTSCSQSIFSLFTAVGETEEKCLPTWLNYSFDLTISMQGNEIFFPLISALILHSHFFSISEYICEFIFYICVSIDATFQRNDLQIQ